MIYNLAFITINKYKYIHKQQVDCTGQADRDGNKVLLCPAESSEGNASSGSSPAEDAVWIREELHRWIFGNVRAKWESVVRRGEGARGWQRASALFSGYQGFDPKLLIQVWYPPEEELVCGNTEILLCWELAQGWWGLLISDSEEVYVFLPMIATVIEEESRVCVCCASV